MSSRYFFHGKKVNYTFIHAKKKSFFIAVLHGKKAGRTKKSHFLLILFHIKGAFNQIFDL